MTRRVQWPALGLLVLAMMIGGCRSLTPPVTYYTMNFHLDQDSAATDRGGTQHLIGIQPVDLPGYVNRLPMVRRVGGNQLAISSLHRWADYPDRLVQLNLRGNLQWLMPHERVIDAPWPADVRPDVILSFQILELIGTDSGEVVLNVVWHLSGTALGSGAQSHRTRMSEALSGSDFDALAQAHSRVLERFCRQVAEVLQDHLAQT